MLVLSCIYDMSKNMLQFCANSAARPYFLCDVMTGNHISISHANFQPTRYSALCSIHFEAQCFSRMFSLADLEGESGSSSTKSKSKRRLEKGSIPTIHAANEPPQKESISERSHRQVRAKGLYKYMQCKV